MKSDEDTKNVEEEKEISNNQRIKNERKSTLIRIISSMIIFTVVSDHETDMHNAFKLNCFR